MEKTYSYYGLHACEALYRTRPQDIRKAYFLRSEREFFAAWAEDMDTHKIPVKWVEPHDLEKLTDTVHHQGLSLVALDRSAKAFDDWIQDFSPEVSSLLFYLDGVGNPHNLGAIVRSAAHFGVAALLGEKGDLPRLTPAATRTAEGGAEAVELVRLPKSQAKMILELKEQSFEIVAAGIGEEAEPLPKFKFSKRTLVILGSEQSGISDELAALADRVVTIPGTGQVESLNVSVSAAILMAEFNRQQENGN